MDDEQTSTSSSTEDSQEQAPKQTNKKQTPASAYVVLCIFLIGSFLTAYAYMNDIWMFSTEFKPGPVIALEVTDLTLSSNMAGMVAQGTVTNSTDNNYKNVQVEVNLYDADGNLVGTATETTDLLEAGQEWNFSVVILNELTVTAELKEVTGY